MSAGKQTYVTFVLDETGSMQSIKGDTIGGFNSYLETLRQSGNDIRFSLIKFDSSRIEKVCADTPIHLVEELNDKTYNPGAMTPLIDACYKAIKATEEKVAGKDVNVAIVIQTDGYENCSAEYSNQELAALIKEKTAAGWSFNYIGAGIDAFSQAAEFGIAKSHTMSYGRQKSAAAFAATARSTAEYSTTGDVVSSSFSDEERRSAGEDSVINPGAKSDMSSVVGASRRVSRDKSRRRPAVVDDFSI